MISAVVLCFKLRAITNRQQPRLVPTRPAHLYIYLHFAVYPNLSHSPSLPSLPPGSSFAREDAVGGEFWKHTSNRASSFCRMIFKDASSTFTTRRISLRAISSSDSLGIPAMVLDGCK